MNAHTVHCSDPWPVPEKLFLPLAQTMAQLSSNPHTAPPPPTSFLLLFGVERQRVLVCTQHAARSAHCDCDEEWLLVATFNPAHWITGSDKHGPLCLRKWSHQQWPWTLGACLPPEGGRLSPRHLWCHASSPACNREAHGCRRFGRKNCSLFSSLMPWDPVAWGFGCKLKGWDYGSQILVVAESLVFPKKSHPCGTQLLDINDLCSAMPVMHAVEACPLSAFPSLQIRQLQPFYRWRNKGN